MFIGLCSDDKALEAIRAKAEKDAARLHCPPICTAGLSLPLCIEILLYHSRSRALEHLVGQLLLNVE